MRTKDWTIRGLLVAGWLLGGEIAAGAQQTAEFAEEELQASQARAVFTGDHTVEEGQSVQDVVVVGGDLRVRGTVNGDAVVVGGRLILEESGMIHGDATVTGGTIVENGGRIRGEMRMLDARGAGSGREIAAAAAPHPTFGEPRMAVHEGRGDRGFSGRGSGFRAIRNGFFGLVSTLALGLVLAGMGAVLIFYGRPYLDTVSDTIRGATGRSAAVGLAASFLIVPAFVVLVVALAVTIIGIPLLLLAIPLYPLALAAAFAFGFLAVAHAIGERTSEQRDRAFDFRYRNSYSYLFTGLGMLLMPLLAANLISMTGFLGFIGTLLKFMTLTVIWAATTVGLGAVILSRGGTRRTFVKPPPDLDFESDPFLDSEPPSPTAHA